MAYPQEHKVFGLQDIFAHIITYLNLESQVACLQVSRLFHEAITPKVYASVTLSPLEVCRPSLETLRRYSSLVMALSFDAFISAEYLGAGFRNLKSLSLTNDQDSYLFKQGTALSAKVWEAIEGTAHRLPEVSKVERHNAQDSTATATDYSSTSVVIAPQGGSDIHRVSSRIVKERVHHGRLRSGIELQQVTPASISQEELPWATIACEKAEALLMIPAKLEPFKCHPGVPRPSPTTTLCTYRSLCRFAQCLPVLIDGATRVSVPLQPGSRYLLEHFQDAFYRLAETNPTQLQKTSSNRSDLIRRGHAFDRWFFAATDSRTQQTTTNF